MNWNRDMTAAPRTGEPVIFATKCGKVIRSHWLKDAERWEMLATGEAPVAWQFWPKHPGALTVRLPGL